MIAGMPGLAILNWGAHLEERYEGEDGINAAFGKYGVFAFKMHKKAEKMVLRRPRWWLHRVPRTGTEAKP